MDNINNGISPNPFEKLNETELLFLLEHDSDKLTEAQKLDIKAKLNNFQIVRENETKQMESQIQKVYTKTMPQNNKAGYTNIIVLMLTVWITCLCGVAYIYFNIIG